MLPAVFDQTTIDISTGDYTFRATGSVQKFDGYLRVYQLPASNADREDDEKGDEGEGNALPRVNEGQVLRLEQIGLSNITEAAPLDRSHTGKGSGRKGHRPAFHLRSDYFHDCRA